MAAQRAPHMMKLDDADPPLLDRAVGPVAAAVPMPSRDEGILAQHPRTAPSSASTAHPAVALIKERLVARDQEIQELLVENQRLATTHVALQQQLAAAKHKLRAVSVAATRARAEREGEVRALTDQAARSARALADQAAQAEAQAVATARAGVDQVHADVQVLATMLNRLQGIREKLAHKKAEASRTDSVRAQIETMRREIQKGRAALAFEKKARSHNLKHRKAMEKHMIAVASEIERLRGELANAEKGVTVVNPAAAVGNSGNAMAYGNSEATYTAQAYPEAYSANQAHMHTGANSQYMSQPVSYGQYESQHTNIQR